MIVSAVVHSRAVSNTTIQIPSVLQKIKLCSTVNKNIEPLTPLYIGTDVGGRSFL
jgi:hypothetical protein